MSTIAANREELIEEIQGQSAIYQIHEKAILHDLEKSRAVKFVTKKCRQELL